MPFASLWIAFTIAAAASQTVRNAMQRSLVTTLGTVGATHVRFLFGVPFALVFFAIILGVAEGRWPQFYWQTWAFAAEGAVTQIIATALMLAAMRDRSFVVTIAYTKTEAVQAAVFGLAVLGDHLSVMTAVAITISTFGVMLMSWPKADGGPKQSWKPVALGLLSGAFFALSAIGYRGGILSVTDASFVMAATSVMTTGLLMQSISLSIYLGVFHRPTLRAIFAEWKPSLIAGFTGALASEFWFLAFALTTAAKVRTLGLVEVLFAQFVSRRFLNEGAKAREIAGIGLILVGIVLLVQG